MKKLVMFLLMIGYFSTVVHATNYGLTFDGTSSTYVSIPNSSDLNFTSTNAFTIEFWIKPSAISAAKFIGKSETSGASNGYAIAMTSTGQLFAELYFSSGTIKITSTSTCISANQWSHIAVTWTSGGYFIGYVNGVQQCSTSTSGHTPTITNSNNMIIGRAPWSIAIQECYSGIMDEIRIWDYVRTQPQIQSTMNTTVSGSESGLVAYYQMSDGSGSTLTDNTPNLHTGTISSPSTMWTTIDELSALPVELTSFTATTTNAAATLAWKTATETNNYGFEVERRVVDNQDLSLPSPNRGGLGWGSIGFVVGNGTSNKEHSYSYTDANIASGTYAYRLKQIDNSGTYKYSSEAEVSVTTPKNFMLSQNYPNPFNPTTTIAYQIPAGTYGNTSLRVYDVIGREVATLVNESKEAGSYQVTFNASKLASGVYFYRLQSGNYASVKKLLLMK